MSSVPASSIGTFSVLPLVLIGSISSAGIGAPHGRDEGRAIDREAAARRRGAEGDLHGLRPRRHSRQGSRAKEEMSAMGHGMSVAVVAAVDFDRDVAESREVGQAHPYSRSTGRGASDTSETMAA